MNPDIPPYIYIVFTAATAIGVLMQAGILLGMFLGLRRLQNRIEHILNHVSDHALPLIASSKVMLHELSPQIKTITGNLLVVSENLKHESHNIRGSVDDVLEKTRAQTARVDEMVSGTLDGISHAGAVIQHGIEVPLRQLNGILNGLKAGFNVFREKNHQSPVEPIVKAEEEVVVIVEEVVLAESESESAVLGASPS
jgi:hypothetical protein